MSAKYACCSQSVALLMNLCLNLESQDGPVGWTKSSVPAQNALEGKSVGKLRHLTV